jgi:membrane protease YdiL (CAAX protease family)
VLSWLPAALLFAVINPAQEEIRFRVVPLATLAPAVGDEAAIWMTSAVFGLAHWSEATPSGPIGLVFHGLVGALLAKSILETRGVAWAWIIHAAGNLVLFIGLVLDAN